MPKGPQGQKRPADVIGAAVMVGKIATGEAVDTAAPKSAAAEMGANVRKTRAANLTKKQRTEIAKRAAKNVGVAIDC